GADQDVLGRQVQLRGDVLGGAVRVLEALEAGAGVGAAGVQDDSAGTAVGDGLAGPEDGRRLDAVGGEDGGGGVAGAVVDDEGDILLAGGLQTGGEADGPEA